MKFPKLRAAANAEILAVIENLPVSANGFFLTAEQMASIEGVLTSNETTAADLVTANEALTAANGNVTRLTGELSTVKTELSTANAEVIRLGNIPGKPSATVVDKDKFEAKVEEDPMAFDSQKEILKRFE